jgi:tetratricopeptide (TPR) repeat protein
MTAARLILVLGITAALTLRPSVAYAQLEAFVQAVRGLADAAGQTEPPRSTDIRSAADRMAAALAEWDRNISALEGRVARLSRESAGVPNDGTYRLHVELGVAYRVRGRVADALRELDAAATLRPSSSDLQMLRALTLEAAGRPAEAGKAFLDAWHLDTGDPVKAYYVTQRLNAGGVAEHARARALLTDAYQRLGDAARPGAARPGPAPFAALNAIPDTLLRTPVVAGSAVSAGFALLAANKYDDAVAAFRRPVEAPGGHAAVDEAARREEERAALERTLAGRNVPVIGVARRAQIEGDPAGAIEALTQALRFSPNDPNIHKELASVYTAQGRADDAFCELMAALLIDRRDAGAHSAIGQLYLDSGHDAEAVAAFNRALELMPAYYETRYALATAHTRLGHTAEAARQLDLFERARREALEQSRRDFATEAEREEAVRRGLANQPGSAR